jgi:long-chain acyl-CoA synthetase
MTERLTIIDFVEKYVKQFSENPFLWEKNLDTNQWEPTTYAETLTQAKRIAAGLMALGVEKGDKISYLSEGRNMWVIGELGVLFAGAVNVPLSIKLEETNDLVFRVKHSDSKYVITSKF